MPQLDVNLPAFEQANGELQSRVQQVMQILEQINSVVQRVPDSLNEAALVPYQQRQQEWNAIYQESHQEVAAIHASSVQCREIIMQGDQRGASVMQG